MTFLVANGFTIPIKPGTVRRGSIVKGERRVTRNAIINDGRRQTRRTWTMTLVCQDQAEASAVSAMLHGIGHYWSFDDGYHASTSLGPADNQNGIFFEPGDGWGGGRLVVPSSGAFLSIKFATGFVDEWTVLVRSNTADAANGRWHTFALTSLGNQYKDGVKGHYFIFPAIGVPLVIDAAGDVSLFNTDTIASNFINGRYSELVALPWLATDAMISAFSLNPWRWGSNPLVHLRGDFFEAPLGISASVKVDSGTMVDFNDRGARGSIFPRDLNWANDPVELDIVIEEDSRTPSVNSFERPNAYWPLDSRSLLGGLYHDLAGSNEATPVAGAPTATDGPSGALNTAIHLNGVNFLSVPDAAALEAHVGVTGKMTLSFWMRRTGAQAGPILSKRNDLSANDHEWLVDITAGDIVRIRVMSNSGALFEQYSISSAAAIDGSWNHFAFVYDATKTAGVRVKCFKDGTNEPFILTTGGAFVSMADTAAPMRIGDVGDTSNPFLGDLADVFYSAQACTHEQIRTIYLLGKVGHRLRRA